MNGITIVAFCSWDSTNLSSVWTYTFDLLSPENCMEWLSSSRLPFPWFNSVFRIQVHEIMRKYAQNHLEKILLCILIIRIYIISIFIFTFWQQLCIIVERRCHNIFVTGGMQNLRSFIHQESRIPLVTMEIFNFLFCLTISGCGMALI